MSADVKLRTGPSKESSREQRKILEDFLRAIITQETPTMKMKKQTPMKKQPEKISKLRERYQQTKMSRGGKKGWKCQNRQRSANKWQ